MLLIDAQIGLAKSPLRLNIAPAGILSTIGIFKWPWWWHLVIISQPTRLCHLYYLCPWSVQLNSSVYLRPSAAFNSTKYHNCDPPWLLASLILRDILICCCSCLLPTGMNSLPYHIIHVCDISTVLYGLSMGCDTLSPAPVWIRMYEA